MSHGRGGWGGGGGGWGVAFSIAPMTGYPPVSEMPPQGYYTPNTNYSGFPPQGMPPGGMPGQQGMQDARYIAHDLAFGTQQGVQDATYRLQQELMHTRDRQGLVNRINAEANNEARRAGGQMATDGLQVMADGSLVIGNNFTHSVVGRVPGGFTPPGQVPQGYYNYNNPNNGYAYNNFNQAPNYYNNTAGYYGNNYNYGDTGYGAYPVAPQPAVSFAFMGGRPYLRRGGNFLGLSFTI